VETLNLRQIAEKIIVGILITILGSAIVLLFKDVIKKIMNLDLSMLKAYWLIIGIIISIFVFLLYLIYKRMKFIKLYDLKNTENVVYDIEWMEGEVIEYEGVKWQTMIPRIPLGTLTPEIAVVPVPRCPNCGTELEEHVGFWGGYIWECVNCGFKKRNKHNFDRESARVLKIAKQRYKKE